MSKRFYVQAALDAYRVYDSRDSRVPVKTFFKATDPDALKNAYNHCYILNLAERYGEI